MITLSVVDGALNYFYFKTNAPNNLYLSMASYIIGLAMNTVSLSFWLVALSKLLKVLKKFKLD